MNNNSLDSIIRQSFTIWGDALYHLSHQPTDSLITAINLIDKCTGRVIISGMGKSGHIARKIAASFASIGEPSYFLHPSEALHGDIGVLNSDDILIAISKSGHGEVVQLIPYGKRLGVTVIAITSSLDSPLAQAADLVLDTCGNNEAGPLEMVPTTSIITSLAIGDALLIGLIVKRALKRDDFAILHPAGSLGKKLLLHVEDLMLTGNKVPKVPSNSSLMQAILKMTANRGITAIIDEKTKQLVGVLTDGDIRRLLDHQPLDPNRNVAEIMTKNPKTIDKDQLAVVAAKKMADLRITALIVVNEAQSPVGIIHLHDMMAAGVV